MKYKIVMLIIVLNFTALFSQEAATIRATTPLENVTIKGRKKNVKEIHEFKRHAQSTEVLTHSELNRNNPAFIEQSLNTMAGVQVDKRTQLGGQRIVIRGYGNDQKFNNWGIKVYFNNMPVTTADGVTILDDIDFTTVDNIEVIKGPAASEYGAGVGGTVRFYLKTPEEKGLSFDQKSTFGSFNLFQSSSRINYKQDKSSMFLNYTHLESNGYRPHGASAKTSATYFGEFAVSAKEKMGLYMSYNDSYEQIAGQISYADYYAGKDPGNSAYSSKNAGLSIKSTRIGVSYENKFSSKFRNNTTLFYYNSDQESISAGAYGVSTNPNKGLRSVFSWKENINKNWDNDLDFGTEIQQSTSLASSYRFLGTDPNQPLLVSDISKASYFQYKNNQLTGFANDRITYKPADLSFIFGISANSVDFNRKDLYAVPGLINGHVDQSFAKSFGTAFNPRVAIQKTINKNHIINLSYNNGYNSPTAATSYIAATNQTNDNLKAEKARMIDFSAHGLLFDTKFDYQFAVFNMEIDDKLTQLSAINPQGGAAYTYWANTGNQSNKGIEASLGYLLELKQGSFLKSIQPFGSMSFNNFKYTDFKTQTGSALVDYSQKKVVGVPNQKFTVGIDFETENGLYWNNTFNHIGNVYTDFGNTNSVKGFDQLNSKIGYRRDFFEHKLMLDLYVAGNNLTNQINYTFLFLGNNINDHDNGSNYPTGVATDVNPGPSKAYYFGGVNLKFYL
ncbi:TonB-dependent receptor [Flavobacterium sp. WC2509]|uniref:TonB-dependent receptor n=1 Tax=Flavobacterium sp. WC2509 TaxID=3461406 RepID=UPI00404460EF